jgi:hypothetical protein
MKTHPRTALCSSLEEEARGICTKRRRTSVDKENDNLSFHEFRKATLKKYPNLSFLGPASMAVYWNKVYLRQEAFGWVHCKNTIHEDRRKKSYFCHVPGQYFLEASSLTPEEVIQIGTPGFHYATSYIGVYNLLRSYGKFARDGEGEIVLIHYRGPDLPSVNSSDD